MRKYRKFWRKDKKYYYFVIPEYSPKDKKEAHRLQAACVRWSYVSSCCVLRWVRICPVSPASSH